MSCKPIPLRVIMKHIACLFVIFASASATVAAEKPPDSLAKAVLGKAGVRVGVCEIPRVGDGTLAAALAKLGIAQVHALAPDAKAAEAARKPAADAHLLGSQVVIETGSPGALPLGDWVADLLVVTDATDANLASVSAAEVGRVLSPYRGTAVVGSPDGAKAGLSKEALTAWAKGTGGTATIGEDASGVWVVVKMPPLKGGDDWSHYYHGPDGNSVSNDTAFRGERYQLQWHDLPIQGERNYTVVASAGRLFVATCSNYWATIHTWLRPQHPYELQARSLYNAKLLWRRPISARFGDMGSLLVATPDHLYAKDGTGVLVLNPETGEELSRIAVTEEPQTVRWLALSDGVLLALACPKPFDELHDAVKAKGEADADHEQRVVQVSRERDACQELTAWEPGIGKKLWQFKEAKIMPRKLAVSDGRVFLYVNDSHAMGIDLKSGKELWRMHAPSGHPVTKASDVAAERRGEMLAFAAPKAYVIFDHQRRQHQAFDAADGHVLWTFTKWQGYPDWANPSFPLLFGNTLLAGGVIQCDLLTGKPVTAYPNFKNPTADSCGHATALESGLWIGNGVWDMTLGKQLMSHLDKSGCGLGYFVANGTEVLYPNMCSCFYIWSGMFVVRPAPQREPRGGTRLEKGDALAPAEPQSYPRDWPTYRADETRRGSSPAEVPAKSGIRWIYTPERPKPGQSAADLPAPLQRGLADTQVIAVGTRLFFGTPEGAVVCLDRTTGTEVWRYWTAGAIEASPTWALGRVFAGSEDGWVYCLDASTGKLCWRYRVAPEERRLTLFGGLGSAWPVWSNMLVHDGVAYVAAGIRGRLDGSALCALDAQSSAVRWEKLLMSTGETDVKGQLVNQAPSGGGQMAWYDGKLWWHGGEWGLAVVDPTTGALKRAIAHRACDDFTYGMNEDLGILPRGWVTFGGWKPIHGVSAVTGSYQAPAIFFRSGPGGLAAGDQTANALKDTSTIPHLLKLTSLDPTGSTRVNRQIPVWDDRDALLPGDFTPKEKAPLLCPDFAAWLNAEDEAHPPTVDAKKRQELRMPDVVRVASLASLPSARQRAALPDDLNKAVTDKKLALSGMMLLSGNAVVVTGSWDPTWPGTEMQNWRAIAVSRADRSVLWAVRLPVQPALSGMSLTCDGDVLIPLMDGRVVCIGADATERPVPAAAVEGTQPGLMAYAYATDAVPAGYRFWTPADFALLKPVQTTVLPELQIKTDKPDDQTLFRIEGFVEVPETGKYSFNGKCANGGNATFTLYDGTRQFTECEFYPNQWGGRSDEVLLEKGKHPVTLLVMQGASGKTITLQWERPGGKPASIPAAALSHMPEPAR